MNLFDIVRQAQGGSAMDNLSRQFGLSNDQTLRALEALLPAFTLGFRQNLRNPTAFGHLLDMMASGSYAPFFDGSRQGAGGHAVGQPILDALFGSREVTHQIAAQASAMTGIGAQVLQQFLPALAPLLLGGLFRQAGIHGLSDFLRAWSDWLRTIAPPETVASRPALAGSAGSPFGAWGDMMGAMFTGDAGRPAPSVAPPAPADPWTSFMQAYLRGLPPGADAPPPPPAPPSEPNPFDVLSQMFESGREVQSSYLAGLQGILDTVWRPPAGGRTSSG